MHAAINSHHADNAVFMSFNLSLPHRHINSQPVNIVSRVSSVLVVDDSATMCAILHDMLMRLGLRNVDEARDGYAALAKIRGRAYSLIISDWHMEPMKGIDLLREVRRISIPGQNRFIFSTADRSWGSQTSAKLAGAEAFLIKPFSIETLKAKIEDVLHH